MDQFTGVKDGWVGDTVEQCLKAWWDKKELKEWWAVTFLTSWEVLLAQNSMLFEDKGTSSFWVAFQIRVMATAYKMPVIQKPERQTSELVINKEWAWGSFDGSS